MNNETFMKNLINMYPNLKDLVINNNTLSYNNSNISLNNIDLETFFKQNVNLYHHLSLLTSREVFKIIACHIKDFKESKVLLNLDENIIIRGMRVVNHKDQNGIINSYLYLIDENEMTYIEPCDYAKEAFNYYEENIHNNFKQLTVAMLNNYLRNFLNNDLKDSLEIKNLSDIKDYLMSPLKEKYQNYLKENNEELKEDDLVLKRKVKAGYFNGLLIIGIVMLLGITLSFLLVKGMR